MTNLNIRTDMFQIARAHRHHAYTPPKAPKGWVNNSETTHWLLSVSNNNAHMSHRCAASGHTVLKAETKSSFPIWTPFGGSPNSCLPRWSRNTASLRSSCVSFQMRSQMRPKYSGKTPKRRTERERLVPSRCGGSAWGRATGRRWGCVGRVPRA